MTTEQNTLPVCAATRAIDTAQWNTLKNSLFPGAKDESIAMVWDYCKARQLDPLKKPCHIVPISVKVGDSYQMRDVVMPGIYEYRTTAQRTGEYLGYLRPDYGPSISHAGVDAPEYCDFTVYRWNKLSQSRIEFPVRVYFYEVCAINKKSGEANDRWSKAPFQMLTKCAEAAALRAAFPDELGGTHTEEEMVGKVIDHDTGEVIPPAAKGKPPTEQPKALPPKSETGEQAEKPANEAQVKLLRVKLNQASKSAEDLCKHFNIDSLTKLPFASVNDALAWIASSGREPGSDDNA